MTFLFYLVDVDLGILRVGYSLLLVFFLPGYMILTAVFTTDLLGIPERIAYAVAISIATTALSGLLLDTTHWGLQPVAWVSLLTVITLTASVVAFLRISYVKYNIDADMSAFSVNFDDLIIMGLAGVVVVLALLVARVGAERVPSDQYTEFWMVPQDEAAPVMALGIRNQEQERVHYRLELKTRNNLINEWEMITLESGETWEERYPIPLRYAATTYLKADLFRLDDPSRAYRQLTINYE